jgi:HD-GYP domain-containing protein (c-di-GMP phosphodiesterase class II)
MSYRDFKPSTRLVLAVIWTTGALTLAWTVLRPLAQHGPPTLSWQIAAFIVFATVAELFPVKFEIGGYEITVSTVFLIAAILTFHGAVEQVVLIGLASAAIANLVARKPWFKACTNLAIVVLVMGPSSVVFDLIGTRDLPHTVAATTVLLILYFVLDTVPMTWLLSSLDERPFKVTYLANYQGVFLEHFGIELFGVLFAIIWAVSPFLSPLFVLPIVILHQAYFQAERLRNESITALGAMADLIENRDVYTHNHTNAVSTGARRLAERLRLDAQQVWHISVAGRLHDLGKVVVSDAVLLKPGRLTAEEMTKMEDHCRVGYEVLARFSSLQPVARLIRSHHERFDGKGYPDRLAGKDLPVGAAIIAVVDAFDAMTTDRPYRKAMPVARALDIIQGGLGTQWEPTVGAAFIELVREDERKRADDQVAAGRSLPRAS